jgi:hypothetical protein
MHVARHVAACYPEYWQNPRQKGVNTPRVDIKILSREKALTWKASMAPVWT